MEIAGFRLGSAAYLTDVSDIPSRALRCSRAWTTWCSPRCATSRIPATPRWSRRSAGRGASAHRQTWLTHIAHELGHEETNRTLPAGVALAYDGLTLACEPMNEQRCAAHDSRLPLDCRRFLPDSAHRSPPSATSTACIWATSEILSAVVQRKLRADRAFARSPSPSIRIQSSFLRPAKAPAPAHANGRAAPSAGRHRHRCGAGAALRRSAGGIAPRGSLCAEILVEALRVRSLHEGGNFRFGYHARGGRRRSSASLASSTALPCMCTSRCACAGLRFQARRFARWWPRETCAARAGCWAVHSAVRSTSGARARDRDAAAGAHGESGAV